MLGLIVLVALVGWLGGRARGARSELVRARAQITTARTAALRGDLDAAAKSLATAGRAAHAARGRTSDPVWRTAAAVPLLGRSLRAGAELARAADDLTNDAGPDLLACARALESAAGSASPGAGTRVDLAKVRAALEPLRRAQTSLAMAQRRIDALPHGFILPTIGRSADTLRPQIAELADDLEALEPALEHAPSMLGEDGPKSYFLAFQTLAESRGTGGLIGAFSILTADHGSLTLSKFGNTSRDLRSPLSPVVDLGPEFSARYKDFLATGFWSNVNASPHFPYTDQIVRALWQKQFGQKLDGTIALDSFTLANMLKVTGPVTLSTGEIVTPENVVDLSLCQSYIRYDADQQNEFNRELSEKAGDKLLSGLDDPIAMLRALGDSVTSGHLQMAVADPDVQKVLEQHKVGGALSTEPGPYVGVSLNNAGATKLDYYLAGSVDYDLDRKSGLTTVALTLRNTVSPARLPKVGGTSTGGLTPGGPPAPPGRNRLHVSIYCGVGATLQGGSLDGVDFIHEVSLPGEPWILGETSTLLEPGVERGHGVFSTYVDLEAGASRTLTVTCNQQDLRGAQNLRLPTLVNPLRVVR